MAWAWPICAAPCIAMLDIAPAHQRNVIVRPRGPGVTFIQLDDLKADQLPPLAPAAFLTLETSPGNYQAWLALPGTEDKDFARRLRKGTGADTTASGATRVAGSLNFKDKYAPNFPACRDPCGASRPPGERRSARRTWPGRGAGSRRTTPSHCPRPCFIRRQSALAELCALRGRRAAQQRRHWPRCEPRRFRVLHDRDYLGLERGRHR